MSLANLFGTWLPFIGWREYDEATIFWLSLQHDEVDASRRYSGFQFAWLGITLGWGVNDIGPREEKTAV